MPTFVTIGYGDQNGYDHTARTIRDAAHTHDAMLRENGVLMGIAGSPVQVRNPDASGVETMKGPFMRSALPVAGFAIIHAANVAIGAGALILARDRRSGHVNAQYPLLGFLRVIRRSHA
jgi:hypothetical protein